MISVGSRSAATRNSGAIGPVIDSVTRLSVLSIHADTVQVGEHPGVYAISERERHRARRRAAKPFDGVGDDDAAIFDDGEPVDDALDLVEFVRRQEDGAAVGDSLAHDVREFVLEQRVQAGGRFVQHQQVGAVHERQHDADLLPVTFGQRVDRAVQLRVEAFGELVAIFAVAHAAYRGEPVQVLPPGQLRIKREVAGQVADAAVDRHAVADRVEVEHAHATRRCSIQAQQ